MAEDSEPTKDELEIITTLGRMRRMVDQGHSLEEALKSVVSDETAEGYVERNRAAMDALEQRILSPEYMDQYSTAMAEPDEAQRAQALAKLKRENFAAIDMAAVHRAIASRNRQWKAEGILPPDSPT